MDARILVVTHKPYWMPQDPCYLPVQVGAGSPLGMQRDNTGTHIAGKNPLYCELTALYWAIHNLDADAIGLAHYRRHFAAPGARGPKQDRVLTGAQLRAALAEAPILLPRKRRYFIETTWSQYAHAHGEEGLRAAREVIAARHPAYLAAFDRVMARTSGHRFNMLVMRRDLLSAYGDWLFDVLDGVERAIADPAPRLHGFIGERLLDCWLEGSAAAYAELPVMFMEQQNWAVKGGNFLLRKVRGGRHGDG